jgi:hypothetical protein
MGFFDYLQIKMTCGKQRPLQRCQSCLCPDNGHVVGTLNSLPRTERNKSSSATGQLTSLLNAVGLSR